MKYRREGLFSHRPGPTGETDRWAHHATERLGEGGSSRPAASREREEMVGEKGKEVEGEVQFGRQKRSKATLGESNQRAERSTGVADRPQ